MSNLRTDYKDDVYTGNRKYHMNNNGDGTVSFTDETQYIQNGDRYGAEQINEVNGIINNLDNNVYKSTDAAMTDIADNDYIPIYDTSASARKKTLWSNIKNLFTQSFAIKVHSSNSAGTYGAGTDTHFGHVRLSDSYTSEFPKSASQSVGASEQAVTNVYSALQTETTNRSRETSFISANLNNHMTANNQSIYMDYQDGKYGINTSANRSADTFIPFKINKYQTIGLGAHSVIAFHNAKNDDQEFKIMTLTQTDGEVRAWFQNPGNPEQKTPDEYMSVGTTLTLVPPSDIDQSWSRYISCEAAASIDLKVGF